MPVTLYGIPNCDTVKRARAWLAAQDIDAVFHDFKKAGVPPDALDRWLDALGWEALLNRRGSTWRQLAEAERAAVVDRAAARALMLARPSVIRRPVLDWHGALCAGFEPAHWARLAAARPAPRPPSA